MNRRWLSVALVLVGLAGLGLVGYWQLFTHFMAYDDEGYVLWSLRTYFAHGQLYTQVYSQYGPFPFVFYHALHVLTGCPVDNESARFVTLFYWCGCSALAAALVWQQTRSIVATAVASLLTFAGLLPMVNEPGHPGGLLAFLAAVGAYGGARAIEGAAGRTFAIGTTLVGTAMLLSKINVGLFFLISAGSWLALHTALGRWQRVAMWCVILGCALSPLLLLHALSSQTWVVLLGVVFAGSAFAVLVLILRERDHSVTVRAWPMAALAAGLLAVWVVAVVWTRGTPLAALWQGMVLEPLRHPLVYVHALHWPVVTPWLAITGLLATLLHHRGPLSEKWSGALAMSRLLACGWLLYTAQQSADFSLAWFTLEYGLALTWVLLLPLQHAAPTPRRRAQLWVAWVFVWQILQVYPVAGSQAAWGGFLWYPLAIISGYEALVFLAARCTGTARLFRRGGAVVALVACALLLERFIVLGHARYTQLEPLNLDGARRLRLAGDYGLTLRILARNIEAHADTLFSYPGMYSFNLWTARPTPTRANATHWFSLLNDAQQQDIIARLADDPRAVIIRQTYLARFLGENGVTLGGPLHDYVQDAFVPAFRVGSYEFLVHHGRHIAPLGIARLDFPPELPPQLDLITNASEAVGMVELQLLHAPFTPLMQIPLAAPLVWSITPLADDGTVATARTTGLTRLRLTLPLPATPLPMLTELRVVLRERDGHVIETLRFAP
ncbi:MAG: hypothetical protein Q8M02_06980 [Candidatus Didemnitutus sp.]|nr:hypothetical protein [Candidatus Didemnitutus sp.]